MNLFNGAHHIWLQLYKKKKKKPHVLVKIFSKSFIRVIILAVIVLPDKRAEKEIKYII